MKKAAKIFLQYLLDHQNPSDNYFNRFFLLKHRLIREQACSEKKVDQAKIQLEKAGLIAKSNGGMLFITDEGKKSLYQENRSAVMGWLEKYTLYFNRKLIAIAALITLIIGVLGLKLNAPNSIVSNVVQSVIVHVIDIKNIF